MDESIFNKALKKTMIYNGLLVLIWQCCLGLTLGLMASVVAGDSLVDSMGARLVRVPADARAGFLSEEKVAVVVGVSRYPSIGGLKALEYADDDAKAVAKQLKVLGYKVRVVTNEEATRGAVVELLQGLGRYLAPGRGTFLFYFSGHGFAKEGTNYLATIETDPDTIQYTGLALNSVIDEMQATGAKRQVLLIDACRYDFQARSEFAKFTSRSFVDFDLAEGTQILFSTQFGGKSYEYRHLRQGLFTYYILKGLRGEARQIDGMLTFRDLADYVSTNVKTFSYQQSNNLQVPFVASGVYDDFLLDADKTMQTKQESSGLRLPSLNSTNVKPANPIPPKKRPWYKNPWVWLGVIAGGGSAVYFSYDRNRGGDRASRTE